MVPKSCPELTINCDATSVNFERGIFIKPYPTITASGDMAPIVYIVADDHMQKGEIDWHVVNHLSIQLGQPGIVVFSKTRLPDKSFIENIRPTY